MARNAADEAILANESLSPDTNPETLVVAAAECNSRLPPTHAATVVTQHAAKLCNSGAITCNYQTMLQTAIRSIPTVIKKFAEFAVEQIAANMTEATVAAATTAIFQQCIYPQLAGTEAPLQLKG